MRALDASWTQLHFYLASPYARYEGGHEAAWRDISAIAARLVAAGVDVFSPIAHSHSLAVYGEMDKVDHDFWLRVDEKFMMRAEACMVAMLPGWQESKGVTWEIEWFEKRGKLVLYLDPNTLNLTVRQPPGR